MTHGSNGGEIRPELQQLCERALSLATPDERQYLPVIRERIGKGSLAELVQERFSREKEIVPILTDMAMALRMNRPYGTG